MSSFHPWAQWSTFTGRDALLLAACYAIGCCTAGYYWVRWRTGLDLRFQGSGNLGARNVGRIAGPSGFAVTLLIDGFKGAMAMRLAVYFGASPDMMVACMVAVIVGHNWPIQLRFHGGKGIATSLGALLAYDSLIVLILIGLFAPIFALLRSFTLSGLLAFALSPLVLFLYGSPNTDVAAISFIAIIVLISHRKNIREEIVRTFSPTSQSPGPTQPPNDEK
jgi:glycerol-3-phosphate acyltransferase PlsY